MRGTFDTAHLRICYINSLPFYASKIDGFYPKQEMEERALVQGGSRTIIYYIGKKTIEGTISMPIYVGKDGTMAEGCKEIIRCADNPFREFDLVINRGMMHEPLTADVYNSPVATDKHKRMTFDTAAIQKLSINISDSGPATFEVSFVGIPSKTEENDQNLIVPNEDMMHRQCTYADCLIAIGEDNEGNPLNFKENTKEFSLVFENKIEGLYLLGQDDYATHLYSVKTNIGGQWTEAVHSEEWDDEAGNYNHGGYVDGEKLKLAIADAVGYVEDVLYSPQEQPLGVGLLKKITNFKATFRYGWVDANNNLVFSNL